MSKKEDDCCTDTCLNKWFFTIGFIGTLICGLIFILDYYPLTNISMKNGYCTNMVKTDVATHTTNGKWTIKHITQGIYYYDAKIYDSINGTYIGNGNGCYGTFENSYMVSAGISSKVTNVYPYEGYNDNVPAWLCSFTSEDSSLWPLVLDDVNVWNVTWTPCQYGSLKDARKEPWSHDKVANVGNNDWLVTTSEYGGNHKPLNETDHYYVTVVFLALFSIILTIVILDVLLFKCIRKWKEWIQAKKIRIATEHEAILATIVAQNIIPSPIASAPISTDPIPTAPVPTAPVRKMTGMGSFPYSN
jgi:hypothetical protein